jgi:(p)ppGpp synthase/HD superfamily hydrolase
MEQEELLDSAIALAKVAHTGQTDKAGKPYFSHPLRVMDGVTTYEEKMVAILHDTVEDTDITLDKLRELGFPETVIAAVDAITKPKQSEPYETYIERVSQNQIARRVKVADLKDNLDLSRIPNPTQKDYHRCEKYRWALAKLDQEG